MRLLTSMLDRFAGTSASCLCCTLCLENIILCWMRKASALAMERLMEWRGYIQSARSEPRQRLALYANCAAQDTEYLAWCWALRRAAASCLANNLYARSASWSVLAWWRALGSSVALNWVGGRARGGEVRFLGCEAWSRVLSSQGSKGLCPEG